MLLGFLDALRAQGVPVGVQEWLTLLRGLSLGLHESSLRGFYELGRCLLVHSEAHFDAYDKAFAQCFEGIEAESLEISEALKQWLADPAKLAELSEAQLATLKALDLDQLQRLFRERLAEQEERHQGGNRWIGTGGTSPFGNSGYHPTGLRVGGPGGGRSAAQIAGQRRYRAYRDDLVLDVRQIRVALRKLRDLRREGRDDELDLEQSIDRTCRNAGDLELIWRAPRRNNVKLLLMMDVGGSMDPYARTVGRLFSAAHQSKQFRDFHAFYFHNCVYERVYHNAAFRQSLPLDDLLQRYGKNYKLVLVGDALMHPLELFSAGGTINFFEHNVTPGIEHMRRLSRHFSRTAWLNPEPKAYWQHPTVEAIGKLFPMFPLTLSGLQDAVAALVGAKGAADATRGASDEG